MSKEELGTCHSCFEGFNNKERLPKILSCYHTYCKSCLEEFMFDKGKVTCLGCGTETQAKSVNTIPDNPYFKPKHSARNRVTSGNGDEFYYSDSDNDDDSGNSSARSQNRINGNHVQGVRNMVINTQKSNIAKVRHIVDQNLRKIKTSKTLRMFREARLKETLQALGDFKNKLQEEYKAITKETEQLNGFEAEMNNIINQLNTINVMDFGSIKTLNENSLLICSKLNQEIEKVLKHELENSVRQSVVKINFTETDSLLTDLNANKDTIYMKLLSTLENDPSFVVLTTFMLGKIFTDRIASHNEQYEHQLKNAFIEEGSITHPPLDDPTEYIDYVKSYQPQQINNSAIMGPEVSRKSNLGSDTSRSTSPLEKEEKDWKIVGSKEKKDTKKAPLSFSDMAKKPGNPKPIVKRVPFPEKTIAQTNRPHCYFKIKIDNEAPFRIVFEMRPDMAPKMVDNFIRLCKGLPDGRGYKGSKIFRAKADDHILGGDFENDDGTGGHSAYDEKYFLAEQCPLKDHKGAIRMKGLERTADGRCKIGSQFMIWVGDLEYKEYRFTLVFGKVVEGFEKLQEVSRIKAVQKSPTSWVLRQTVSIVESGVL